MEITGGIDWAMWLQMPPPYTPALEPPNKNILNETFWWSILRTQEP